MPLSFWSFILRVRDANSLFLSFLYWSVTGSKVVNSSCRTSRMIPSRTLLSLPSSRLSVLLSSSKLITTSAMPAKLFILMTFS